ncbi:phosphatase PAP2 family protein [Labilibaculum sp. K2S]|uniref:phosphatase PAP2 family protein n=1 Tax=Labilibaculum sp. K2S TaxID=3056386 RepID=UPI0025A3BA5C|nr:phosphatase PAP2 family protein [Labilibaculum sp. K2S]MDM8160081.1 phosphatase PAP2 family protein [Labilibaculum sp. K2S]
MRFYFFLVFFLPLQILANSSVKDSLNKKDNGKYEYGLTVKKTIVPLSLITLGIIGIKSDGIEIFNQEVREEVQENIDRRFSMDDFLQYAPAGVVYANNLLGVKGRHSFSNQLLIQGTSLFIMGAVVNSLKHAANVERPDHSGFTSFPSGHTAMAFVNAELLWQEYKDVSIWYGIAGYSIAASVGIFRVVNNKHWVTDVAAGAGIGILSTKISYLIYEKILTRKKNRKQTALVMPFYNTKQLGLSCSITF